MVKNFSVIIQARMGSKRFPGKTMYSFSGKPSICHLIDSVLELFDRNEIIVATSYGVEDLVLKEFCERNNLPVFCGDNENVALRFKQILEMNKCDYFIRLCADSPLFDYRIIKKGISLLETDDADLVTSALIRNFPSGMNMEIVKRSSFLNNYRSFKDKEHFEHVTKYFYDNKEKFKILVLEKVVPEPAKYKFSFDTFEDKERIVKIFDSLDKPHHNYSLSEKCQIYERLFL